MPIELDFILQVHKSDINYPLEIAKSLII